MGVKVERSGTGFRVSFSPMPNGRPCKVQARNVQEVGTAIEHWYGGHPHHTYNTSNCPLCALVAAEEQEAQR